METGPRFDYNPEPLKPRRSPEDLQIEAAMRNKVTERDLFYSDHVMWLKGAIGLDTDRGASEITNDELAMRYFEGGVEWDPLVKRSVRTYLHRAGYI